MTSQSTEQQVGKEPTAQAVPESQVRPAPPKPDEVVSDMVDNVPALAVAREALVHLVTTWILFLGNEKVPALRPNTKAEDALKILATMRKWSLEVITADVTAVRDGINSGWNQFNDEVYQVAQLEPAETAVTEGDIQKRTADEVKEHNDLMAEARKILQESAELRTVLNVPLQTATPENPLQVVEEVKPHRNILGVLGRAARSASSFLVDLPEDPIEQPALSDHQQIPAAEPGWDSRPVLSLDNELLQRFRLVLENVRGTSDPTSVWPTLELFGIQQVDLANILIDVEKLARDQITLSNDILTRVTHDNQRFAAQAADLEQATRVWKEVVTFFKLEDKLTGGETP